MDSVEDAVSSWRLLTVSNRCLSIDPEYPNLYLGAHLAIDTVAHLNECSLKRNVVHDAGRFYFFSVITHASSGSDIPFDRKRSLGIVAGEKAAEIAASGRCCSVAGTTF